MGTFGIANKSSLSGNVNPQNSGKPRNSGKNPVARALRYCGFLLCSALFSELICSQKHKQTVKWCRL